MQIELCFNDYLTKVVVGVHYRVKQPVSKFPTNVVFLRESGKLS